MVAPACAQGSRDAKDAQGGALSCDPVPDRVRWGENSHERARLTTRTRSPQTAAARLGGAVRSEQSTFIIAAVLLVLGFFLIWPVVLILLTSFNTAPDIFVGPRTWGLENWRMALAEARIPGAIANTFMVWGLQFGIAMPVSVLIAWTLARTRIPFSHTIEFMFWVAYITPGGVIAWMLLLDPDIGYLNILARNLPFVDRSFFNIFSVSGIVWTGLMGNGIALKVMLLTPSFRNMDAALEEAARVGGSSTLRTMMRITIPMMISPIALVSALQIMRIFQSSETEFLLGVPIRFYVYSTLIFDLVRQYEPPRYGQATVLASITLIVLTLIIPLQRWILHRRRHTTLTSGFRPGLVGLGTLKWPIFSLFVILHLLLTVVPVSALVLGSFMIRTGYFQIDPVFTTWSPSRRPESRSRSRRASPPGTNRSTTRMGSC